MGRVRVRGTSECPHGGMLAKLFEVRPHVTVGVRGEFIDLGGG